MRNHRYAHLRYGKIQIYLKQSRPLESAPETHTCIVRTKAHTNLGKDLTIRPSMELAIGFVLDGMAVNFLTLDLPVSLNLLLDCRVQSTFQLRAVP